MEAIDQNVPLLRTAGGLFLFDVMKTHVLKEFKDRHIQADRNDFNGIERGIGQAVFNSTQISLIEPTKLTELDLSQSLLES